MLCVNFFNIHHQIEDDADVFIDGFGPRFGDIIIRSEELLLNKPGLSRTLIQ